ncbi:uncharacterized protein LOC116159114 [Photinus pyralis]|uniref:uncharacterized protein LOC116159114 n=1 Tax=Photinus pyralis TaxID=7054 RepID=UPI001266EBE6|nr:uncharacterized protein LOC116159114 [Photinus pyralis]
MGPPKKLKGAALSSRNAKILRLASSTDFDKSVTSSPNDVEGKDPLSQPGKKSGPPKKPHKLSGAALQKKLDKEQRDNPAHINVASCPSSSNYPGQVEAEKVENYTKLLKLKYYILYSGIK